MIDEQTIKKWKENLAKLYAIPLAETIGNFAITDLIMLSPNGEWQPLHLGASLHKDVRYRLRPDYQQEPEMVKCEIYESEDGFLEFEYPDQEKSSYELHPEHLLHQAISFPDFIATQTINGNLISIQDVAPLIRKGKKIYVVFSAGKKDE